MHLTLPEELLLLALNERKGTTSLSAAPGLPYGLVGGCLMELALLGRVRLDDGTLVPVGGPKIDDDVLERVLERLEAATRFQRLDHWLAGSSLEAGWIRRVLLDRLVGRGILRREESRVLRIFPRTRYPELDARPELEIRRRLRAVLGGASAPDGRTAALVVLVHACGMVGEVVPKAERREARSRAQEIAGRNPVGGAIADALAAVHVALGAAILAASS